MAYWNFFTNYGHVLFVLSQDSCIRVRDLAERVGITERAAQKIIHDLEKDGYIRIKKIGRNNSYTVDGRKKLRHPIEEACRISELIRVIEKDRN